MLRTSEGVGIGPTVPQMRRKDLGGCGRASGVESDSASRRGNE